MKTLIATSKNRNENKKREATLAVKCLCSLLTNHYQFNLADTICKAVIPFTASKSPLLLPIIPRDDGLCNIVVECLGNVFKGDAQGSITYNIVQQMAAMIRSKEMKVPARTLQV